MIHITYKIGSIVNYATATHTRRTETGQLELLSSTEEGGADTVVAVIDEADIAKVDIEEATTDAIGSADVPTAKVSEQEASGETV